MLLPMRWVALRLPLCLAAFAVLQSVSVHAQTASWSAFSSGGSGDVPAVFGSGSTMGMRSVIVDTAGNSILTGYTQDIGNDDYLTVKYDPAGNVLWSARYDGLDYSMDQATAVALDAAGNVFVTGRTERPDGHATVKYAAATGAVLWVARSTGAGGTALVVDASGDVAVAIGAYLVKYSGATGSELWRAPLVPNPFWSVIWSVAVDGNGSFVVAGQSDFDYVAAKHDGQTGVQQWLTRAPNNGDNETAHAVVVNGAGDVFTTGYRGPKAETYKYAGSSGVVLWTAQTPVSQRYAVARAIALDSAGDVVIAGFDYAFNGSDHNYMAVKYDGVTGAEKWYANDSGTANGFDRATGSALAIDASDNVVIAGVSFSASNQQDLVTVKYSGLNGATLWHSRIEKVGAPTFLTTTAAAVAIMPGGDVISAGSVKDGQAFNYVVNRYAAQNGVALWSSKEPVLTGLHESTAANSTAVDAQGNTIVAGYSGAGLRPALRVSKYSAGGQLLWTDCYLPGESKGARAAAVALDSTGDVVVAGTLSSTSADAEFLTIKYAGASGVRLWSVRYAGSADGGAQAYRVSVDASDNVIVAGASFDTQLGYGLAMVKYSSGGKQLWDTHYDEYSFRQPVSMALDPAGSPVVAITATEDYLTMKFSNTTGERQWLSRYDGPAHRRDTASAMAVDSKGDVLVTGISESSGSRDMATVRYDGVTGQQIWVARESTLMSNFNAANAITTDQQGNVLVAGVITVAEQDTDFITLKYRAADGGFLWFKQYGGTSQLGVDSDRAVAIAVDHSNRVVVTGSALGFDGRQEFATLAYAADGTELWRSQIGAGSPGSDYATALAIAPDDSVRVVGVSSMADGMRIRVTRINQQDVFANGFE